MRREPQLTNLADRNRHIMKSTIPTSHSYVSPSDSPDLSSFLAQFECMCDFVLTQRPSLDLFGTGNGTIDFVPYLSVRAALEFRHWVGGEEKINAYCHSLALKGGKRLAELLGTSVMDEDGDMTANMVHSFVLNTLMLKHY